MEFSAMLGCPEAAFRQADGDWQASVTEALRGAFAQHAEENAFYRAQCEAAGVRAEDFAALSDLVRIPLLPVRMFKQPDAHVLMTAPLTDVELEIRSTGTGGVPSVARRDTTTTSRVLTAIFAQYREFFGIGNGAGLFLCPSTAETPEMGMVKAFNVLNGLLDDHAYVVRDYAFDPEEALGRLDAWEDRMTRHIIGPPFLVGRLLRYLEMEDITLKLDPGSHVITLGGWKRYTGESISREEFNAKIEKYLGIPAANVRDMYGMIESNMLAMECEQHRKHVPPWSYISIRDVEDTDVELAPGKTGVIALLDALNTGYPGFILSEDVGEVDHTPCPCGRTGQTVSFRRRLQGAELGCCAVSIEKFIDSQEIVAECEVPQAAPAEG
ncbi:acyl-protein synthetase [Streptomyces palmae]|uniref:Acyl-protein synthetase n=1 Tax=Streptomyces palmae TaxID=1701085 RepID=A0A4Z0HGW2_9ACTN|nr:acyl-protein synthetase [Streptomyces palmae]TGB18958.1 acyl-protein synthetase [Streptomyces palmae]